MLARLGQSLQAGIFDLGRRAEAVLLPQVDTLPAEKQRRVRMVNWCLLVMATMLLLWVTFNLALKAWLLSVWLGGFLAATLLLLWLSRAGMSVAVTTNLACLLMISIILVSAVYSGGLTAAMLTLFAVIPVGAVSAAGRWGAFWLLPAVASVLALHLAESAGHQFDFLTPPPDRALDATLTWVTSALIVTLLIFYYEVARQRAEKRMIEAMLQAEEVSRLKTWFISSFSHEVRTPLHGLLGMLDLMKDEPSAEARKKLAGEARQAGESLLAVIAEVLETSRSNVQASLPPPEPQVRQEVAPAAPASAAGAGNKRVLVVEDDAIGRLLLKTLLARLGYSVVETTGGRQALEELEKGSFQLVFMDCGLPDLSGDETTRLLRQRERDSGNAHVPVVAVSAQVTQEQKERCRLAGMDDFLCKPFGKDDLLRLLTRWVG